MGPEFAALGVAISFTLTAGSAANKTLQSSMWTVIELVAWFVSFQAASACAPTRDIEMKVPWQTSVAFGLGALSYLSGIVRLMLV